MAAPIRSLSTRLDAACVVRSPARHVRAAAAGGGKSKGKAPVPFWAADLVEQDPSKTPRRNKVQPRGGRGGRGGQQRPKPSTADWSNPPEFDDWEEYEASLDLLILEVGQGLAAAWTDAQFERALDGMSSEHNAAAAGEDGIAADDIMGQLLAARGMGMGGGGAGLSACVQLSVDRSRLGAQSLPPQVALALHAALTAGGRDQLGVPAGELDPWARHVVGSVREAVGVSALAFGPLGSREQWLQFVTATTRLHVENLLGREGHYQPGRVRILSEGGAEPASLSTF